MHDLPLRDYHPVPMVRRASTELSTRPPAPMIDAHNHLGRWLRGEWTVPDVGALLAMMDELGIEALVNLDGMWGEELDANLDRYDRAHPGRFATFARWDPRWFELGAWEELAAQLADGFARGAKGLKVWKDLGLHLRDDRGELVLPGDERLDPVWDAVADAGVPVTIHVADPVAFFQPLDGRNERLEELLVNPDWWFGDRERFPTVRTDHRVLGGAGRAAQRRHVDRRARALQRGGHRLGRPHARHLPERLRRRGGEDRGARPCAARDTGTHRRAPRPVPARDRRLSRRTRATSRYTAGSSRPPTSTSPTTPDPDEAPSQGRWTISGLDLPPDALTAIYAANARRLIFAER